MSRDWGKRRRNTEQQSPQWVTISFAHSNISMIQYAIFKTTHRGLRWGPALCTNLFFSKFGQVWTEIGLPHNRFPPAIPLYNNKSSNQNLTPQSGRRLHCKSIACPALRFVTGIHGPHRSVVCDRPTKHRPEGRHVQRGACCLLLEGGAGVRMGTGFYGTRV